MAFPGFTGSRAPLATRVKFLINLSICYSWSNIQSAEKSTYILISNNFITLLSFDNSVLNLSVREALSGPHYAQNMTSSLANTL